jgi:ornithine decarboxylase
MDIFRDALEVVENNEIINPTVIFRKHILQRSINCFRNLRCEILYPVKTNPDPLIIEHLLDEEIFSFDVASLGEIKQISEMSKAKGVQTNMYFMHPIKSRHAIREAYFTYGIRHFSLDSEYELKKIIEETQGAKDLHLHVRVAIPNSFAEINLSEKFGVNLHHAPELIKQVKKVAYKTGVCFHAGSQCMHSDAYKLAINMLASIVNKIPVDYFNVGGGFPSIYPGLKPQKMEEFFHVVHEGFLELADRDKFKFLAEPGRAIVAECMAVIVRVDLRRDDFLYINDGIYGNLFDAGFPKFVFPMRLIKKDVASDSIPFQLYGPTCDSLDYMHGPFYLPSNIEEGDYIEIGQMGSYARAITTNFNGFHSSETMYEVQDEPIMSIY